MTARSSPASSITIAFRDGGKVGTIGTTAAPALRIAITPASISGEGGRQSATRLPGPAPRERR